MRGFSILEILLTIAILALMSTLVLGVYYGFSGNIELRTASEQMRSDLVHLRTRAQSGEDGRHFGMRVVSLTGTPSFYEIFSTPSDFNHASTTIERRETLSPNVTIRDPLIGDEKIIIFQSIRGTATTANIILNTREASSTITVSASGVVE